MKKITLFIAFTLLSSMALRAIDANIAYATFKSTSGNFIEVYLNVVGQTVEFVPVQETGKLQATLEVVIMFKQGEGIVKYDIYRLHSPAVEQPLDFVDMKRYGLENGEYTIEVSVEDVNKPGNARKYNSSFSMNFSDTGLCQSDIQLLSSFKFADSSAYDNPMVKNGYYFESLASNFYDKYTQRLLFYNEIYNADKAIGDDFLVTYTIEQIESDGKLHVVSIGHRRCAAEPVCAFLQQVDISKITSGNYNLNVEVRDRHKVLLGKKSVFFQRSNPYLNATNEEIAATTILDDEFVARLDENELQYALKAIAMQVEAYDGELLNTLIKEKNIKAMRLYLFSYWAKKSPTNPQYAYESYMEIARAVDEKFRSGFGHGFETDRGHIFMKYGAPSDAITVEDEPTAPPYEIWSYNQFPMTNQNNVKFLFYNPSLATNGYRLLHSTARGEISNPRWEVELYSSSPNDLEGSNFVDGSRIKDSMGRRARRLMNDL
ncbi:MAG: GWxTD domain-containing protein [Saprospiraceae bacterium]|nr:MAG: GWxTD domain-containing protein [Saprospiraceae bacterium]